MDALQMQLLPIFASLEMLELVESPMHSFTTPAGHSFVLRQFDDFLYLGVSDSEPQEFVRVAGLFITHVNRMNRKTRVCRLRATLRFFFLSFLSFSLFSSFLFWLFLLFLKNFTGLDAIGDPSWFLEHALWTSDSIAQVKKLHYVSRTYACSCALMVVTILTTN